MNAGCLPNDSGLFDGKVLLRDDVKARDHNGVFPGMRVSRDLLVDQDRPRQGLAELFAPESSARSPGVETPSAAPASRAPDAGQRPAVQTRLSVEAEYTVG